MEKIAEVKKFEEVKNSKEPIIVKFHATWCPDCSRLDAFIDDVIKEYPSFTWYTIDRDELPEIAVEQEVMGIPSLLVYKNGKKIGHLHSANAKTPEQVEEFLSKFE